MTHAIALGKNQGPSLMFFLFCRRGLPPLTGPKMQVTGEYIQLYEVLNAARAEQTDSLCAESSLQSPAASLQKQTLAHVTTTPSFTKQLVQHYLKMSWLRMSGINIAPQVSPCRASCRNPAAL